MKAVNIVALVLVIVGGLNWGLVGAFNFNLVTAIFGEGSFLARTVFALVGVSALVVAGAVVPMALRMDAPHSAV